MLSIVFVLILQIQYGQYFVCPYLTSTLSSVFFFGLILQVQCGQYFVCLYFTSTVWTVFCLSLLIFMYGSGVGRSEGKQVGSMSEESQVRGCYSITFICTPTNQETVSVLEKTQANKIFRT